MLVLQEKCFDKNGVNLYKLQTDVKKNEIHGVHKLLIKENLYLAKSLMLYLSYLKIYYISF